MRRGAHQGGIAERKKMIDRTHALVRSRSTAYYQATPVSAEDLALMRWIDERHLECPFAGARMLSTRLPCEDRPVGRRRVATRMKRMGIHALYCTPTTSARHPAHRVYPYLLRHLEITRSNHVWAAAITYIPITCGFVYLFAVLDWASRRVLSWRLSNTLTTDFCLDAVQAAIHRYGAPDIFNTDQGCQFTSQAFTGLLTHHHIAISMNGQGCWRDNVFVERLWRSVKYKEVYLHAYDSVSEAQNRLDRYLTFYNQSRPHTALDHTTPDAFDSEHVPALSKSAEAHNCRATLMKTELLSKQPRPPLITANTAHGTRRDRTSLSTSKRSLIGYVAFHTRLPLPGRVRSEVGDLTGYPRNWGKVKLCFAEHILMENLHGLVANTRLTSATGIRRNGKRRSLCWGLGPPHDGSH